jgi:hypothetical protein
MRAVEGNPQGKKNQEVAEKIDKRATDKEKLPKSDKRAIDTNLVETHEKGSFKPISCANLEAVAGLKLVD